MLVSLDDVKEQSRITYDAEDNRLVGMVEAASGAVLNYIDGAHAPTIDSNGEVDFDTVLPVVHQAVLMCVDDMFTNRGGSGWENEANYLPPAVVALLYPLRFPAMA